MKTKQQKKKPATKTTKKRSKPNYLRLMISNLNAMLDLQGMKSRTNKSLDSVRYRNAEYWFCSGFVCAMPDGEEKKFIKEFLAMLSMSGRSILTLKYDQ